MTTIRVPGPSPKSFQKNRPISDLIKSQIRHLQHIEEKLPPEQRTPFDPRDLTTEGSAAAYIARVTAAIHDRAIQRAAPPGPVAVPDRGRAKPKKAASPAKGIPLAAASSDDQPSNNHPSHPKKKAADSKRKGKK